MNCHGKVENVQEGPNKNYIHKTFINGVLKTGDNVSLSVNHHQREYTMKNHSGTHLLHSALRQILGNQVMQIGSYNDHTRLRIDINHNDKITDTLINAIQDLVNRKISETIKCEVIWTDYQTAINKYHALAFFGEKYDKEVRVIKFGLFSSELCGGTHCKNSKDIEQFINN